MTIIKKGVAIQSSGANFEGTMWDFVFELELGSSSRIDRKKELEGHSINKD